MYRNRHSAVLGQVEWFIELQRAVDDGRGQLGLHDESRKGRLLVEPAGLDAADAIQVVETVECQSTVGVGIGSRGLRLTLRTVYEAREGGSQPHRSKVAFGAAVTIFLQRCTVRSVGSLSCCDDVSLFHGFSQESSL